MSLMYSAKIGFFVYRAYKTQMFKLIRLHRSMILPSPEHLNPFWVKMGQCDLVLENVVSKFLDNRPFIPLSSQTKEEAKKRGTDFVDWGIYYGILVGFPIYDLLRAKNANDKKAKDLKDRLEKITKQLEEK